MSGPALTPYHHLLTAEERERVDAHFPMDPDHRIVNGMILWEAVIDLAVNYHAVGADHDKWDQNSLNLIGYKDHVGSYQLRDDMCNFIEAIDLAWHLCEDKLEGRAFDFEFVPDFITKLIVWSEYGGATLHPQWLDCIRAVDGENETIPDPDDLVAAADDSKEAWELIVYPPIETPIHWYFELKDQFLKAFEYAHELPAHGYKVTANILRGEEECAESEHLSAGANDAWEFHSWALENGLVAA